MINSDKMTYLSNSIYLQYCWTLNTNIKHTDIVINKYLNIYWLVFIN